MPIQSALLRSTQPASAGFPQPRNRPSAAACRPPEPPRYPLFDRRQRSPSALLTSPKAETTHEGPGSEGLPAAEGYSLKCSGVRSEAGTGVLQSKGRGDSGQVPRQTMMPLPFRYTAGDVPGGSRETAGNTSAASPRPPPAQRAALATVAAAVAAAEAQLPPRPQKAPQTINPGRRRERQRGRIVYPTRLLSGPATTALKGRGSPWPVAQQALTVVVRSCSCGWRRGPGVGSCRSCWPRDWVAVARSPRLARSGVLRGAAAWRTGARIGRRGAAPGSRP